MLLTHPAAKPGVSVYFFSFFFVPLLNSDIFQFSIWLLTAQERNSQDLEEFCTTKQKTTLVHTCSIQTLVWKQHHADHVSCNCPQNSASYSYLIQALKKQVNTAQEKAGKLVIWFCSNLLHLFCIQLLIMFLSMQQSWLMATEQTRTPNEHNPPRTEEMKQCRIPVTPLPPPNQAFWPNTECFLTLSSPWSPTFPKEDVTVHCTKTSHCKFQVGKEVSSFQDCQWLMKLYNVLIKNRVAMFY